MWIGGALARRGDCVICSRTDAEEINARIRAGEGGRPLARDIGVAQPTLHRHQKRCMGGAKSAPSRRAAAPAPVGAPAPVDLDLPPPSADEEAGGPVADSLRRLRGVYQKALDRYKDAYDTTDSRLLAAFLPELRKYGQEFLSLTERLSPHQTEHERLLAHPDFTRAIVAVAKALDRHPEARAEVLGALEELLGEPVQ